MCSPTLRLISIFLCVLPYTKQGKGNQNTKTGLITNKVQELNTQSKSCRKPEKSTIQELNKTINHLKNNKAPGPDKLPIEIFTHAKHQTREIYLKEINKLIIKIYKIPDQWQIGEITRLYKRKCIKGKCSNDRGITAERNFGKLFERIINNRITPKIRMTEAQPGGHKSKATVDHLLRIRDTIKHLRHK